jgi:hypothetical protein
MIITMPGGTDASDKYHKEGEKSREPDNPANLRAGEAIKTGFLWRSAWGSRMGEILQHPVGRESEAHPAIRIIPF